MQRSNNNSNRTNRGKKVTRQRRRPRQLGPQITSKIRTRRFNYSVLPIEMNLKLKYVLNTTVIATTTPYTNYFGLFEYLNRKPLYSTQMFSLYKKARVVGVKITVQLMNSGANPVFGAIAALTYIDQVSWGPLQAEEFPGGIYKVAAGASGSSKITMKRSYDSKHVLGNQISSDHTAWMDAASASNTTPLDNEDPVIGVIFGPTDGSTSSNYTISFKVEYSVIYFDRTLPGLSVHTVNVNKGVHSGVATLLQDESANDDFDDHDDSQFSQLQSAKVLQQDKAIIYPLARDGSKLSSRLTKK